jgi:hypothetical protein
MLEGDGKIGGMNLTIELSDEKAPALKARAEARGLTVERWLEQIAEQYVQPVSIAHLQKTNPKEWARQFHEWTESHDRTTPVLSDEDMSRESIY